MDLAYLVDARETATDLVMRAQRLNIEPSLLLGGIQHSARIDPECYADLNEDR